MVNQVLFLADFSVIKPDIGLLFWTSVVFIAVWTLLGKFAFKPISKALRDRELSIQEALDQAKKAREEMSVLHAQNEQLLREAREERAALLKEAKETKESIIAEAREKAKAEASQIITSARNEIDNQKKAAMNEIKNQAGILAIEIAEKVVRKELKGNAEQEQYVKTLVNEIKFN